MAVSLQALGSSASFPRTAAPLERDAARTIAPASGSAQSTPQRQSAKTLPVNADEKNEQDRSSLSDAARQAGAAIQQGEAGFAEAAAALNASLKPVSAAAQPPDSSAAVPDESGLAADLISQKFQIPANAAVLKTTHKMLGTLLDIQA